MKEQGGLEISKTNLNEDSVFLKTNFLSREDVNQKYLYLFTKRLMDILGSLIGLIFLSPLFIAIAFAIKNEENKGTVFFTQTRVGKNGEKFKMYKFRSMCLDAENKLTDLLKYNEVEGAMFKIKEDPRVTKIGHFIRKTSIDELPQLWNVLKGDMSLVGPRPPLEREVAKYTVYDKQRLLIKPGCTGIWQISGRNDVGFYEMVEMDVKYIKNLSITNDIKIIFKTVWVMIKPNGAY